MGSRTALSTLIVIVVLTVALFGAIPSGANAQTCSPEQIVVRGDFGEAQFTIELADDPAERSQGLMHRESMARSAGMLFVYERPQPVAFWMKNTLIPLDMIFADETGQVVHIHENAVPHDETPIPGGQDIFAVLEINAGISRKYGFQEGDALQHPAFLSPQTIFPCKE